MSLNIFGVAHSERVFVKESNGRKRFCLNKENISKNRTAERLMLCSLITDGLFVKRVLSPQRKLKSQD